MTPYGRFESKDWFCNRKRSNDIFEIYVLSYNMLHLQNVHESNYCKLTVVVMNLPNNRKSPTRGPRGHHAIRGPHVEACV